MEYYVNTANPNLEDSSLCLPLASGPLHLPPMPTFGASRFPPFQKHEPPSSEVPTTSTTPNPKSNRQLVSLDPGSPHSLLIC